MNIQILIDILVLFVIGCFHHFDWKRRMILSLEGIKQSKQDLLSFASGLLSDQLVIVNVFFSHLPLFDV